MSRVQTIVVPIDGSLVANRVLPVVRSLAGSTGADVILVTSNQAGAGAATAGLDVAREDLPGLEVHCERYDDRNADRAAIDVTTAGPNRLLVMSTHGRGGVRRALLGSVAGHVVRSGEVPVLLVGPACDPGSALDRSGPVLLCIDGSERSARVVAAGRAWASLLGRDVQMVFVANPLDTVTPQDADRIAEGLSGPLAEAGLSTDIDCVLNTSVAEGLVEHATSSGAPLMVIAASTRSARDPMLVGSTTMTVLGHAPCPVLVIPGA